eukprot:330179_1
MDTEINSWKRRKCLLFHGYCRIFIQPMMRNHLIPPETIDICAAYFWFLESYIMKNNSFDVEKKFFEMLHNKFNSTNFELKRVFCTNINGNSAQEFHNICDKKHGISTIVLIQSENGNIFGGYSDAIWDIDKCVPETKQQFLFLLHSIDKDIQTPKVFIHDEKWTDRCSVYHNSSYGPVFGLGHDIAISPNKNESGSTKKSYKLPNNKILAGKSKFTTVAYEVYECNFK